MATRRRRPKSGASCTLVAAWLELQRLGLEELLEAELAELAAVAGLLVAAERSQRVEAAAVDLDLAGADLAGDLLGPLRIAGPHAAGEAIDRVVGDLDGLFLGVVGNDREDGTEDLLLLNGHPGAHLGEHGRPHEVALVKTFGRLGAAGKQLGALLDPLVDVVAYALALRRRHQRTKPRGLTE